MITTYFLLVAVSIVLIIAGVLIGKKLRDMKDASDARKAAEDPEQQS